MITSKINRLHKGKMVFLSYHLGRPNGAKGHGSRGLQRIKLCGGLTIVQPPASAEASAMPQAAISLARPDLILPLQGIAEKLVELL